MVRLLLSCQGGASQVITSPRSAVIPPNRGVFGGSPKLSRRNGRLYVVTTGVNAFAETNDQRRVCDVRESGRKLQARLSPASREQAQHRYCDGAQCCALGEVSEPKRSGAPTVATIGSGCVRARSMIAWSVMIVHVTGSEYAVTHQEL